jgi:hypothetical protein
MNIKFITLGSDPEFFVLDPKGIPYPATNFSKGTKDSPSPIESSLPGFFEQRDNVSFEGNIPPAKTREEFISNVTYLRNYFVNKVSKFGYSISSNGVEYFRTKYLGLPEAKEFGCSSVISSWDSTNSFIQSRPTPVLDNIRYRVSGFHVHIGYSNSCEFKMSRNNIDILIGRLFDIFLTVPSHLIKNEPERLQSYGAYGMIRSKSYGVECRTLSTFFTQEKYLGWVWDQVMKIEEFINTFDTADLLKVIRFGSFVGTRRDFISSVSSILSEFDNKEGLKKFEELKDYNYEAKKVVKKQNKYTNNDGNMQYTWNSVTGTTFTVDTSTW